VGIGNCAQTPLVCLGGGWGVVLKIHNYDSHEMAELILIYMTTVLKRLGKIKNFMFSVFILNFCDVAKLAIIQKERRFSQIWL
jgi:hypothetical protein